MLNIRKEVVFMTYDKKEDSISTAKRYCESERRMVYWCKECNHIVNAYTYVTTDTTIETDANIINDENDLIIDDDPYVVRVSPPSADEASVFCENCDAEMIGIDKEIAEAVIILNHKGYPTEYSCSAHPGYASSSAYIAFNPMVNGVPEPIPDSWIKRESSNTKVPTRRQITLMSKVYFDSDDILPAKSYTWELFDYVNSVKDKDHITMQEKIDAIARDFDISKDAAKAFFEFINERDKALSDILEWTKKLPKNKLEISKNKNRTGRTFIGACPICGEQREFDIKVNISVTSNSHSVAPFYRSSLLRVNAYQNLGYDCEACKEKGITSHVRLYNSMVFPAANIIDRYFYNKLGMKNQNTITSRDENTRSGSAILTDFKSLILYTDYESDPWNHIPKLQLSYPRAFYEIDHSSGLMWKLIDFIMDNYPELKLTHLHTSYYQNGIEAMKMPGSFNWFHEGFQIQLWSSTLLLADPSKKNEYTFGHTYLEWDVSYKFFFKFHLRHDSESSLWSNMIEAYEKKIEDKDLWFFFNGFNGGDDDIFSYPRVITLANMKPEEFMINMFNDDPFWPKFWNRGIVTAEDIDAYYGDKKLSNADRTLIEEHLMLTIRNIKVCIQYYLILRFNSLVKASFREAMYLVK